MTVHVDAGASHDHYCHEYLFRWGQAQMDGGMS